MEEKKLVSHDNQVVENCERNFHFSDGVVENTNLKRVKLYGRDLLLQLRLHPLSLQKPKTLPDMEVVKEKLYMHDITDTCATSTDRSMDISNYHTSMKPEYCNMKHEYPLLPHYMNRLYPYCFPSHMYHGAYQNSSSKFRPSLHTYCSPLKKHCYKDFPVEECLWPKRCYASSEDMWSCYPSHLHSNFIKKKEHFEAVPKSRKKLPIIDPATGKNVLEAVSSTQPGQQNDVYPVQENSESSESCTTGITGEKYSGDYFYHAEVNDGGTTMNVSNDVFTNSIACSSENKIFYDKLKSSDVLYEGDFFDKRLEGNLNPEEMIYDSKSAPTANSSIEEMSFINSKDETAISAVDSSTVQENTNELAKHFENIHDHCDTSKVNKKVPKACQYREVNPFDCHSNCQAHHRKECNMHVCKENVSKQSDSMKENLNQVRDKIYALRQEQQKMAILQSFLRYKKYQLEETAKNLDDKRIEIANWECNLFNKAKRLHDRELWLESKSEILYNKAQQLAEKENILSKEESKSSGDCISCKNVLKETQLHEKKFALDNCSDASWDEISGKMKGSYQNDESNDHTYFGYAPSTNKVADNTSSDVERCKSDACSLDELEKNIVYIEKMHSSNEGGDGNLENKMELASSNSVQKKDESDPLGYSKGRRYLPEHIKYWLNKRDKSNL